VKQLRTKILAGITAGLVVAAGTITVQAASAADNNGNPFQRGPDPTVASLSAPQGGFETESVDVPRGNGFGGGVIYYPKDTSKGKFGAIAFSPGMGTEWRWYAWLGPRLASFGFVVFGTETNTPGDWPGDRATQLLAALDWLTRSSPVKDRVDPNRLAVTGHSAGGAGAQEAALRRPSLKAAIGLAAIGGNLAADKVPTMLIAGQADGAGSPQRNTDAFTTIPGSTPHAYVEIAGAGHGFPAGGSVEMARNMIAWMKLFIDNDTRYAQFLCPDLADKSGISQYLRTCPLTPPGTPANNPAAPNPAAPNPAAPNPAAPNPAPSTDTSRASMSSTGNAGGCRVTYTVAHQWSGGFLGLILISNGGAPMGTWTLSFDFPSSSQRVVQGWGGKLTQRGSTVTVSNASWNGSLAPNTSARIGLVGLRKGDNPVPTNFTLNGASCNGSAPAPGQPSPTSQQSATTTTASAPSPKASTSPVTYPTVAPTTTSAGPGLSVDLGAKTKPATRVGEGFLYGVNQDGTLPSDDYLLPLGITAYRGGGHVSRGWIGDGYRSGSQTKAQVDTVIAQAKRLTRPPYNAQYQVILSDIYGADGGQPGTTRYPCDNGDCSNWITFIDTVVGELEKSGLKFSYDIWNEPDIDIFWKREVNSPQYFQMWDTAVRELRKIVPKAEIVGPSLGFVPQRRPEMWKTWFAHAKTAGTLPDMITSHPLGVVDDPVAVAQALNDDMVAAGITPLPLSANEYQPADRQTAGVTAWYLARFAQSDYVNALRGNWVCCLAPNLTGILTENAGRWTPNGNWWVMRAYADLTGMLVNTSGAVGSTSISAAEDSTKKQAVALIGDSEGRSGTTDVTFRGLASVPWLAGQDSVNVVVQRIPEQAPLAAPQEVLDRKMTITGGTVTVPVTFQAPHDAFAIYLTPAR
jgi:hypothetical protein